MKNLILTALLVACGTFLSGQSVVGTWETIDDETGKAKSHVEIFEKDGKIYGKVVKVLTPGKENAKCEKCKGSKKNQPIVGLEILRDVKKDGDKWGGGRILDPNKGKEYKVSLELKEADKLKVRGFVGFSLLGRTQYWHRVKS